MALPGILQRLISYTCLPPLYILTVIYSGFGNALRKQLAGGLSLNWLNIKQWWKGMFEVGFGVLLASGDKAYGSLISLFWPGESAKCIRTADDKSKLVSQVSGVILEVGPGSGETVKYYNPANVKKIYGVEPFLEIHRQLRQSISRANLSKKYEILGCSIDDTETLLAAGIKDNSVDAIVCVQVLCSIPDPKGFLKRCHRLLKKGGKLYLFEHVRSDDAISRIFQTFWTELIWRRAFGGCELNRSSGVLAQQSGEWVSVNLGKASTDTPASLLPHAVGVLTKA